MTVRLNQIGLTEPLPRCLPVSHDWTREAACKADEATPLPTNCQLRPVAERKNQRERRPSHQTEIRKRRRGQRTPTKKAAFYLRVSTSSQVKTDYNPEGISLPAQREGCEIKRAELGAEIVREFIEPGRTATSIDKRPVFQEMLAWVKERGDIDYIIVYHFNRIFRDSVDSHVTKRALKKVGTRIVSTLLDLGESAEGDIVESIIAAVDQYQSAANGADISYKMSTRPRTAARSGGKIGYLNKRDTSEGRNIGIVVHDPERAPFIPVIFELYATRQWSLEALQDEMTQRGLRTRAGRFPSGRSRCRWPKCCVTPTTPATSSTKARSIPVATSP